ncbi:hypothetical protein Ate02nite_10210 [Paractinoplanes tereljensis]|uniref:N-acetyltransferase domain-containing protein n=1 Tax=Paractinoplanes tereljensis TaxID=571912 RepID=A0A919TQH7_9ACTN|nr:hypothetical protein Ate02nite_10210 [Actinoplanes tereljensis]
MIGHIYLWEEPADEKALRANLRGVPLIMNLWVDPEYRRQGIGTILMEASERRLRLRGHRRVALGVDTENKEAVRLYQDLAYIRWEHGEIETHRDHFLPTGHFVTTETCAIFVKCLTETARPPRADHHVQAL